jgi:hypothetical protein
MASSLRGYLRRLRLFNLAAPIVVEAMLRLDGMDHGGAPSLSQQPPSFLPPGTGEIVELAPGKFHCLADVVFVL